MTQQESELSEVKQVDQAAAEDRSEPRPRMVDWYSPRQLAGTGIRSLVSMMLGQMLDPRRLLAVEGTNQECVFDYSDRESFSFDYMADTGDGWDSTYSMAYLATLPSLTVAGAGKNLILERPDALILGGDEVYPVASKLAYSKRLQDPYEQAAKNVRSNTDSKKLPKKDVFMIPGNHDWYDGLGSMSQKFFAYAHEADAAGNMVRKQRRLGQFSTCQTRSYFVLKLPQNWEIWCVDIQLGNDIDPQQYSFFSWHSEQLGADTKVVLCSAVPTIVYGSDRAQRHRNHGQGKGDDLTFGLNRIARLAYNRGARIKLQIAGDVHNYQHYAVAKDDKNNLAYVRHHLVCGGGGAFLHPTHGFNKGSEQDPRIEPVARYPSREQSQKLTRGVLAFPFTHPGMSLLIAVLYLAIFWISGLPAFNSHAIVSQIVNYPGSILLMLAVIGGGWAFAAEKRWWGLVHGIVHIAAAVALWELAGSISVLLPFGALNTLVEGAMVLAGGFLVGGLLFGLYLWASLNIFRIHHNEAFSALANPHFKSMLRCNIDDNGSLTIHAIGVESSAGEDHHHPVKTHLIETINVATT